MTDATPSTTAGHEQFADDLACLRDRIEDLEDELEAKDERINDLESDRDRLEETTERFEIASRSVNATEHAMRRSSKQR